MNSTPLHTQKKKNNIPENNNKKQPKESEFFNHVEFNHVVVVVMAGFRLDQLIHPTATATTSATAEKAILRR